MKKLFLGVTAGAAVLSLAACGDTATPITPTTGTEEESDLTLEQVYAKAIERQENLQSVKAEMDMDQVSDMTIDGEEFNVTASTNMVMKMTVEPIAFSIDGTMIMDMDSESETSEVPLQMYMTEADGFYINDSTSGAWMKMPNELSDSMLAQTGAQADASEQLKQLQPFINDFKFEQTGDTYILTLNAEGEKFNELIMEQAKGSLESTNPVDPALLEGVNFEETKYIITIDKETFDTTNIDMNLIMHIDIEEQQSKTDLKSSIKYSDFNAFDTITIPQEVLDSAIEATP